MIPSSSAIMTRTNSVYEVLVALVLILFRNKINYHIGNFLVYLCQRIIN